jgi:protein-L-isoaspartate(D-aspartate) O-methyltransferase
MVEQQVASRGVHDERVLQAMRTVPRESFVPDRLREYAYDDTPLPIEAGQTISQPFIVALMAEALGVEPDDQVLEIGAGSGYAAAVLGRVAREVYAVERHEELARLAGARMEQLGYDNVHILHGDGTRGWAEHAPYDAILVSAGGPDVPRSLREQLKIGGRLVMPVGTEHRAQELVRIERTAEHEFTETSLGRVQFVPLIGSEGWSAEGSTMPPPEERTPLRNDIPEPERKSRLIADHAEPFGSIEDADLDALIDRIGDARVVLIGEASHGTSEFYEMRARITRELVEQRGFNVVALEADWPDTATIDRRVRDLPRQSLREGPFSRFPTWMWRNVEMDRFVAWLTEFNEGLDPQKKVSIHGLDLYSLNNSIGAVLDYLDDVDPRAAQAARVRFACFSPWETDPATYGRAAVLGETRTCEEDAVVTLTRLFEERVNYLDRDGESFFDAARNARVIRNAERYYRAMYHGSRESWNLRDRHMFETLQGVLDHRGSDAKAVVWAHNSHVGNASATEMGVRGEINIGQLAREEYGRRAYAIGFGTHSGTVAAASNWNEPVQFMEIRPSHADSYERLCHDSGIDSFFLPLRSDDARPVREELLTPHLERAIGVIYRPQTEVASHYFQAALPVQFDEYVWFDRTSPVRPLETGASEGAETYPFGL